MKIYEYEFFKICFTVDGRSRDINGLIVTNNVVELKYDTNTICCGYVVCNSVYIKKEHGYFRINLPYRLNEKEKNKIVESFFMGVG